MIVSPEYRTNSLSHQKAPGVYIKVGLKYDLHYPNIHFPVRYAYTVKMNEKLQSDLMNSMDVLDELKAHRYQEAQMRIPNFEDYDEDQKRAMIQLLQNKKYNKVEIVENLEEEIDYECILADDNYKAYKMAKCTKNRNDFGTEKS